MKLRLDGCARVQSLSEGRLVIINEMGMVYMMQLQFDQADVDVADAHFTLIDSDTSIIPSSVSV